MQLSRIDDLTIELIFDHDQARFLAEACAWAAQHGPEDQRLAYSCAAGMFEAAGYASVVMNHPRPDEPSLTMAGFLLGELKPY